MPYVFFLEAAKDCYLQYQKQNISNQIFEDTFYDLTLWCENCKRDFGEWGIDEVCWLRFHVCMEVFRLGRLAFQEIFMHHDAKDVNLYQGDAVIEVHIAQGEPLRIEECMASFEQAMDFYHKEDVIFWGESWILHPALQTMLSPSSNLLQFQNLFQIYEVDSQDPQGELRVFGCIREDVEQYPETTSLQRKMKAYLKTHHHFGIGKGIYRYHKHRSN